MKSNNIELKFFELGTKFSFGKYKGSSLEEVIENNPGYVEWCAINVEFFCIEEWQLEIIRKTFPGFRLSQKALDAMDARNEEYIDSNEGNYSSPQYYESPISWKEETFNYLTGGQYGSYDDFNNGMGDFDYLKDGMGF